MGCPPVRSACSTAFALVHHLSLAGPMLKPAPFDDGLLCFLCEPSPWRPIPLLYPFPMPLTWGEPSSRFMAVQNCSSLIVESTDNWACCAPPVSLSVTKRCLVANVRGDGWVCTPLVKKWAHWQVQTLGSPAADLGSVAMAQPRTTPIDAQLVRLGQPSAFQWGCLHSGQHEHVASRGR
jgi:hypothetical protein